MQRNIIIITSDDIRHNYFRVMFSNAEDINVIKTYAESEKPFVLHRELAELANQEINALHFKMRRNIEYDFFSDVIELLPDKSKPEFISRNEINNETTVKEIIKLNPDLIVTYGCSIIKPPLIEAFKNRIINVHLGLSPYYFGAGTNFHALVNNDFQCVGYTFMFMDEGIDTGKIIHQARAEVLPFDNPHQIGNRLIKDMTHDFIRLIKYFEKVEDKERVTDFIGKTYRRKDATEDLTKKLYENFSKGSVMEYLKNKDSAEKKYPIIEQDFLRREI